jgi:hypothetical protein
MAIPAKVTSGVADIQDMRMVGMVHSRAVHGPHGAALSGIDEIRSRRCRKPVGYCNGLAASEDFGSNRSLIDSPFYRFTGS